MNRNYTTILKGISIIFILWGHVGAKLGVEGIQFIAGIGVTLFLICSGYGIMYSYMLKGLDNYWIKKLLKVIIPFYIVEIFGLLFIKEFSFNLLIKDLLFIQAATSYGWYMGYILICYFIFWTIMKIGRNLNISKRIILILLTFIVWFIVDSVFLANPAMPFLRARQMLSFPLGILLGYVSFKKQNNFYRSISKSILIMMMLGCILVGIVTVLITQFEVIKKLPYIMSNVLALITCLPLAIGIMLFIILFPFLFKNIFLNRLGWIGYN